MDIKIKDKTNFGWFYGTHKRITRFALKDLSNLMPHKGMLEEFAQRPDFDETRIFNNCHFYSPVTGRSFFDFDGKHNALAKYMEHVSQMLANIAEENKALCIEHAGRALHYLQDITQVQHSQTEGLLKRLLHRKMHLNFEEFVREHQKAYFEGYEDKPFTDRPFKDIFLENLQVRLESNYPTKKNRYAWDRFGCAGVLQARSSTREFLVKLNALLEPKI